MPLFVPARLLDNVNRRVLKELDDAGVPYRIADEVFHGDSPSIFDADGKPLAKSLRSCVGWAKQQAKQPELVGAY